jgi:hypothetical protein
VPDERPSHDYLPERPYIPEHVEKTLRARQPIPPHKRKGHPNGGPKPKPWPEVWSLEAEARRRADGRGLTIPVPDPAGKPLTLRAIEIAERRGHTYGSTRWHYVRQQAHLRLAEANVLGQRQALAEIARRIAQRLEPGANNTAHQQGVNDTLDWITSVTADMACTALPIDKELE